MGTSSEPPPDLPKKSMDDLRRETAERIVIDNLQLKPDEKFLLIYDSDLVKLAAFVNVEASKINGTNSREYCLDSYIVEDGSKRVVRFNAELRRALDDVTVSCFLTGIPEEGEKSRGDDLERLRKPLLEYLVGRPDLRHAHAPDAREKDLLVGKGIDYTKSRA